MKNIYQTPEISIFVLNSADIITASGDMEIDADQIPGANGLDIG